MKRDVCEVGVLVEWRSLPMDTPEHRRGPYEVTSEVVGRSPRKVLIQTRWSDGTDTRGWSWLSAWRDYAKFVGERVTWPVRAEAT